MDLVVRLHEAMRDHGNDSAEADVIREEMDAPWKGLTSEERDIVNRLSGDLYSLTDPLPEPTSYPPALTAQLEEARQKSDWNGVLDLLASYPGLLTPEMAAQERVAAYTGLGEPAIATLFSDHVARLKHDTLPSP